MANDSETDLGRRDLIKLGAVATLAASLRVGESLAAQSAAKPAAAVRTFFTTEELAMVDELSELIIPADDHSPGARAANVAAYIDSRLAEAWDEQQRTDWREGLRRIEQIAQDVSGKPFMQASADQRLSVLTRMAKNEKAPREREEHFFVELKARVVNAYYTSEIGIKRELEYRGNSYLAEFAGVDVS